MDRVSFLDSVTQAAVERIVTKDELLIAFDRDIIHPVPTPVSVAEPSIHSTGSEVFSYIGGAIVFIGIAILVSGSWDTLSVLTKLLVTLGSGVLGYVLGAYFIQEDRWGKLANAFFLISALVLPIGLFTAYETAGFNSGRNATLLLITAILTLLFATSYWFYRKIVFTVFTVIFATGLFVSSLEMIVGGNPIFEGNIYLYQSLTVGLAYLLLGYQFSTNRTNSSLTGWLDGFGSIGFFGAALALGGYFPGQNIFWELAFPLLVTGEIVLGLRLKNRSLLVWGAIFLMAYILKITSEYFSQSLGWPLALVVAGLSLIGLGYYLFYLNRKYLLQLN